MIGMAGFVGLHHGQDLAAAQVGRRKGLQVLVKVRLHLALGFHHEPQAPAIAAQAGQGAQRVTAGVPQRVEHAGTAVQFAQAVGAPGQVVGLFLGCVQQVGAGGAVTGDGRLPEIQALGADLADMVDAHQAGGMALLVRFQDHVGGVPGGVGTMGGRVAEDGVQPPLGLHQPSVEKREGPRVHGSYCADSFQPRLPGTPIGRVGPGCALR